MPFRLKLDRIPSQRAENGKNRPKRLRGHRHGPVRGTRQVGTPASLGDAEKRAFVDLVMSCPSGQFLSCDLPLLCAWAETVALRERMATRMSIEGELDEKGKPSGAFTIHKEATKTLNALALRLRVSPQSRAQKAPRREVRPVSYYERMELEGVLDDNDARDRDQ
jgi:hypothetical protein